MRKEFYLLVVGLLLVLFSYSFAQIPVQPSPLAGKEYVENQLIIKFKPGADENQKKAVTHSLNSVTLKKFSIIGGELIQISGVTVEQAVNLLKDDPRIEYAEPNYIFQLAAVPNDPYFNLLWGMNNTGQTGGTVDADIDAVEAWNISTGNSIIIGVIDTGVDTAHVDLLGNIWTNPVEIPNNGIDDDSNGYVDDIHGWDFVNSDNVPVDDNGHGTHVSGTIAAVGNNTIGVAGVCWSAKIMALKFLDSWGYGNTANAILAVEYATMMGANLTSNSWGGGSYSQALKDAIDSSGVHGMLFVAAAGNSRENNDLYPHYPSSYNSENLIAVAATDHNDKLANESNWGSCWGPTSVDLGAPGVNIYSTIPGNFYTYLSGTSMATPHVSGAAALIWSEYPLLTHLQVKDRIMRMADPLPDLAGKCVTGGRLNVFMAMAEPDSIPPSPISDLAVTNTGGSWIALSWTATGDDSSTGTASYYDVRYSLSPIDSSNFDSASQASGESQPKPAGSPETFVVTGLNFSTIYYFAVKALDEWGNPSGISNSPSGITLGPPDISVSPDSMNADLFTGGKDSKTLIISNLAGSELKFDISIRGAAKNKVMVDFIADQSASSEKVLAYGKSVPLEQLQSMWPDFRSIISINPDVLINKGGQSERNLSKSVLALKGEVVEIFGNMENIFYGGLMSRGNFFTCTIASTLIEHRFYLSPIAPTQLWFLVYQGNSKAGTYRLVDASYSYAGPGEGWYSSGNINVTLIPGKYYLIVTSFQQPSYHYNQQNITPYPIPTAFGLLTAAAGWGWAPTSPFKDSLGGGYPDTTQNVLGSAFGEPVAYYQTIVTSGPSWLSASPDSGTVPVGSSANLVITFDASGLVGGDYDANIVISSNDPVSPIVNVPARLHVTGAPDIAVDLDSLNFGIVYIGYPERLPILVSNKGTDNLSVTGIVADRAEFSVDITNFALVPGQDTVVNVTFAPAVVGEIWGNLTISSDDPDEPTLTVALYGEGLICPNVWVNPASVSDSLLTGETSIETLTVGNSGGSPLYLKVELDNFMGPTALKGIGAEKPVAISRVGQSIWELLGSRGEKKTGYDPDAKTTRDLYESGQDGFKNISANPGDVLTSWPAPSPIQGPWGLGFDGNEVWISDYSRIADNEVSTAGVFLSWFSCSGWVGVWPADMDWDGNYIWQVNVGGDNGIYQLDPANGSVISSIHDPNHTWDAISQRGLAYDKKEDVFYIGGWNQNRVYKIKGKGWDNPGEILSYFNFPSVSGLAWHPGGTLWIAVNASTDYIFQVNPVNGSMISQFLAPGTGGGYEGAGLATDKTGNLWCISQATHMVYLVESGVPAYQWLAVAPEACTVGVGETYGLEVKFDASGLFGGDYTGDIILQSNDCDQPSLTVPALLHVTGAPDIAVSSDSLEYGSVFVGASAIDTLIVSNEGTDILIASDISSDNSNYLASINSFSLNPGEKQKVLVTFTPGDTGLLAGNLTISSNDVDESIITVFLRGKGLLPPDITVSPDSLSDSLFTGETAIETLTISNTGVSDLTFGISFEYLDQAFLSLHTKMPQLKIDPHRLKTDSSGSSISINGEGSASIPMGSESVFKSYTSPQSVQSTATSHIAVLGADGGGGIYLNDVAIYLINSGRFASVTTLNGYNFTPTLAELQMYDAVVVFGWYSWNNPTGIGDVLADFVDGGGRLMMAFAANGVGGEWQISGRFDSENYWLIKPYSFNGGSYYTLGTVYEPGHPIMSGVNSVVSGSKLNNGAFVNPGTNRIADFSDGTPLVVIREQSGNRRVDISFPVVTSSVVPGWGIDPASDASLLIVNAIEWLAAGARNWLSAIPDSGVVPAGSSMNIAITFDATGLNGGDYAADVVIHSNDPDESTRVVPAHLHVTGAPDIALNLDSLNFGIVNIGYPENLTLPVSNDGTDILTVTGIVPNIAEFSVDLTNFTLAPGEDTIVNVAFAPVDTGEVWGTLTISSNDPDEPSLTVSVSGEGLYPPDISVSNDSLNEVVVASDTVMDTLTINNTGRNDLKFDISVEGVSGGKVSVDFIADGSIRSEKIIASGNPISPRQLGGIRTNLQKVISINSEDLIDKRMPFERNLSEDLFPQKLAGVEIFGSKENVFYAGPRTRGNLFTCTIANTLIEHRFYLNPSTSTQLWFLVYEGNSQVGIYYLVNASNVSPAGPGEGWYSSGNINVPLVPGKYYLIVASFEQLSNYYNQQNISPYPIATSFGQLTAGAGWDWAPTAYFPPDTFQDIPSYAFGAPVAYYQAIVTGAGTSWISINPDSGVVPASSSAKIAITCTATDTSGDDYFAGLVISSNDPDEGEVTVPVHMRVVAKGDVNADFKVGVTDVVYLINYLLKSGPAPKALASGDVNCDVEVTISDIVYLINYLFKGGPKPGC